MKASIGGRPFVEYWLDGYLVVTVTLAADFSPRVDIMPSLKLGVIDVLRTMAALNFAASRAAQMSYAALRVPASAREAREILFGNGLAVPPDASGALAQSDSEGGEV